MSSARLLEGLATARSMQGGQYVKGEGKFLVEITKLFLNDGYKGKFFIAEFSIQESTSALDPVGTTRSWTVSLDGERGRRALGDIKGLIFALTGKDPRDCGQPEDDPALHAEAAKLAMAACDEDYAKKNGVDPSLFVGVPVRLETLHKATQPKPGNPQGGTFTVHRWSPA